MQWNRHVKILLPCGRVPNKIVLAMRLTLVLTIAACLNASAGTYAQQISLSVKNATLRQVFTAIEKQTGFLIFYNNDVLKETKPVTIDVRNGSLEEVLKAVLKEQSLQYSIVRKTIIIKKAAPPTELPSPEIAQTPVNGAVRDTAGMPLMGVSIAIKGTKKGVATDAEGKFSIDAPPGSVLVVSFIGYQPREVTVREQAALNIILRRSVSALDETVVIAYGTTSKRLNTGSVTTVKAEDIQKQPVGNPIIALSGRVPGLAMQQTTGAPGAAVRFNVRGLNSLSGANDPFIIIDGVPFSSSNVRANMGSTIGAFGGASPFNAINTADIESIEVLKDADATSIYGSRGANGVILITTKKGKSGKTGLNVNIYHGFGKVSRKMEMLDTRQYLDMRYEAFANDGVNWRASSVTANDLKVWDTTRYTDWQDVLVGGTAKYTNAQLALNGGNQYTQFSLGGNYWKETSVFPGDFRDQKFSGRFGLNHRSVNERLRVEFSTFYTFDDNLLPSFNPYTSALNLPPNAPRLYKEDGSLNWENGTFGNPLASLRHTQSIKSHNLNSSGLFSYRVFKGLWLRTSAGYSKVDFNSTALSPKAAINPFNYFPSQNSGYYHTNTSSGWNVEPYAEYETLLAGGKLSVLLGSTFQEQVRKTSDISASDFIDDALMNNPASANQVIVSPATIIKYRYNAIFGRLNYNLQNKYIANLTMRRDGSSRFGPGRQFGNFGAIGLAWIFSEENFMKRSVGMLSYGKLRLSYGTTGSDAIGDYAFLPTYSIGQSVPGYVTLKPDRLYNPDYGWETNKKMDVELELGFLNNRIMLSANYYRNRSSNQLVGIPMPRMTGFASINGNLPATVQNTGLELVLNTTNIKSQHFSWTSSLNFTIPRNKLIAYPGIALSTHATRYAVGHPLSLEMLYDFVRVNPETGVNVYRGQNGKDTSFISSSFFTQKDRTIYVNTGPRFYGGLTNEFRYKNFSLDFLLVYSDKTRNNDIATLPALPGLQNNITVYVFENSWRKPGDEALFQKFTQRTSSSAYRSRTTSSSEAYFMHTYLLRLNNLSLSYSLPQTLQKRLHISNGRVYLLGQNLFTITNFKGVDPEGGTTSMPLMRVITAGIQFNL